jgi:Nuclease-related domain
MAYDHQTQPGGWVADQAARRERRIWLGFAVFVAVDGVVLALAVGHRLGIGAAAGFLALVLAAKPFARRYIDEHVRWLRGARAEEAVGRTLNELRREEWVVMHDIKPARGANLDHLASGPNGVYLVETKERRFEDPHLRRVKGQARQLREELGVWVTPVICIHRRNGKPFRTDGVWVVPRIELLDWLRTQRNHPVESARLEKFADSL